MDTYTVQIFLDKLQIVVTTSTYYIFIQLLQTKPFTSDNLSKIQKYLDALFNALLTNQVTESKRGI